MKKLILSFCLLLAGQALLAQSTNDFLINGGLDLIKTDNDKIFGKAQFGIEVNYFIERHFAVGAGGDFWTQGPNSFVLGARWYPNDNVFIRFRGLIGLNDAALGVGYTKPVNKNLRIEGMADLYFKRPDFGLRAGVSYVINYVTKK